MYLYIIDLFLAILGHTLHIFHLFVCFEQKMYEKERDTKTKTKILTSTSINLESTVRQLNPAMVK